jgi:LAO/AO transport system kinase
VTSGLPHLASTPSIQALVDRAGAGDVAAVSRILSLVLNPGPQADEVHRALHRHERAAHVIGVTGPPGAGKSTLVSAMAAAWPGDGRIAVLAIDPSSPLSGGSILGDRVRMKELTGLGRVYVRSVASHGRTGGLAVGIERAIDAVSALGFQAVLVETVGIGQVEVEITGLADTTVAVFSPGQGDIVQAMKSGLNEVADVLVVNKGDLPGAEAVARDLRRLTRGDHGAGPIPRPVLRASATNRTGIEALITAVADHRAALAASGDLEVRRVRRGHMHLRSTLDQRWSVALATVLSSAECSRAAARVASGESRVDDVVPGILAEVAELIRPVQ